MRDLTPRSGRCPRGCVDTEGCGCAWNAPNEKPSLFKAAAWRPWMTYEDADAELTRIGCRDDDGQECHVGETNAPEDAALIVRAVNEYEALLALEKLVRRNHGREDGQDDRVVRTDCAECQALEALDDLRSALAADQEKSGA